MRSSHATFLAEYLRFVLRLNEQMRMETFPDYSIVLIDSLTALKRLHMQTPAASPLCLFPPAAIVLANEHLASRQFELQRASDCMIVDTAAGIEADRLKFANVNFLS